MSSEDEAAPTTSRRAYILDHKQKVKALHTEIKIKLKKTRDRNVHRELESELKRREEELGRELETNLVWLGTANVETSESAPPEDDVPKMEPLRLYGEPKKLSVSEIKRKKKQEKLETERMDLMRKLKAEETGVRERERDAFRKGLADKHFSLFEIAADGNCLFRAIEHQLAELPTPRKIGHRELRSITARHLIANPNKFLPFMEDPYQSEEGLLAYANRMEQTAEWGGEIELQALADSLDVQISVFVCHNSDLDILKIGSEDKPQIFVCHHRHISASPHYNSVIPLESWPRDPAMTKQTDCTS